jgi:hypothetical protein
MTQNTLNYAAFGFPSDFKGRGEDKLSGKVWEKKLFCLSQTLPKSSYVPVYFR